MKRKQLWIAVAAVCGSLAAGTFSTTALAAEKQMPALSGWNLANTQTLNGTLPDGRTWIYPDAATAALDTAKNGTGSTGFVIWELDDASGASPGIQVRTNEPLADWPMRNCIMASGPGKVCGDDSGSSKRFKLRVTGSESVPVDLVFDVADDQPFTYEEGVDPADITGRVYRVLMKWANFTNARAQGFKVELGFMGPSGFVAAKGTEGVSFELRELVPREEFGALVTVGGPTEREVWKPLEFATFSPSMYNPDDVLTVEDESGFFDNQVAGLIPPQDIDTTNGQYIYSGETPVSSIIGATTANYFGQWGYMLNEALLPTGIYQDDDGDPATEGSLIAFWDGINWRYGAANGFAVVPEADLAAWGTRPLSETEKLDPPRYEAAVIDDLAGLNVDVYIRLDENYDPTVAGQDKIVLRLTPVAPAVGIAGNDANPLWIANPAPDIFADVVPPPPSGGGGGCAIGGDGRFDPTLPALAAAGLVFFGLRRFKASK
jgi:hypothetical protein